MAEAKGTDKIRVSWSPPAPGLTNGVIRSYSIIYHPTADPTLSSILNNLPGTEADLDLPMGPGVSYSIRVAAFTVARGPFSEGVIQMTYPLPPSFSSGPPIIVPGVEETKNTITLQLPFVNTTQFRYCRPHPMAVASFTHPICGHFVHTAFFMTCMFLSFTLYAAISGW